MFKDILNKWLRKSGWSISKEHAPFEHRKYKRIIGESWVDDLSRLIEFNKVQRVFDIGANEGQSSQRYLQLFPQAHIDAFEPNPRIFRQLETCFDQVERVTTHNVGVGKKEGKLPFQINRQSVMSSFVNLGQYGWGDIVDTIDVSVIRLDEFWAKNEVIDFVKIDTQGFDFEVLCGLDGLIKKRNGTICLNRDNISRTVSVTFQVLGNFSIHGLTSIPVNRLL